MDHYGSICFVCNGSVEHCKKFDFLAKFELHNCRQNCFAETCICKHLQDIGESAGNFLASAVIANHYACVNILLDLGINVSSYTVDKQLAITFAVYHTNTDIARLLVKHGAIHNSSVGLLCLSQACRIRHSAMVALLLNYGAIPDVINPVLGEPLTIALSEGDIEIIKLLLIYGPSYVQQSEKNYWPYLFYTECFASSDKKIIIIEMLHEFGITVKPFLEYAVMKHIKNDCSFQSFLQDLLYNPRSLLSSCRLVIRRALGTNYIKKINYFASILPPSIMQMLSFADLQF